MTHAWGTQTEVPDCLPRRFRHTSLRVCFAAGRTPAWCRNSLPTRTSRARCSTRPSRRRIALRRCCACQVAPQDRVFHGAFHALLCRGSVRRRAAVSRRCVSMCDRRKAPEGACKPGPVRQPVSAAGVMVIPLDGRLPGRSSSLTRGLRAGRPSPPLPGARPPIRPCTGWGLPSRSGHPDRWCALTAPFHPYRAPESARRSAFCGTVRGVAPPGR